MHKVPLSLESLIAASAEGKNCVHWQHIVSTSDLPCFLRYCLMKEMLTYYQPPSQDWASAVQRTHTRNVMNLSDWLVTAH